ALCSSTPPRRAAAATTSRSSRSPPNLHTSVACSTIVAWGGTGTLSGAGLRQFILNETLFGDGQSRDDMEGHEDVEQRERQSPRPGEAVQPAHGEGADAGHQVAAGLREGGQGRGPRGRAGPQPEQRQDERED